MKRKFALLILMILSLSVALVACNNTTPTEIAVRWQVNEEYTFRVYKADFYSVKDSVMSGETFSGLDEIAPQAVSGTYTIKIEQQDGSSVWTVTTHQELIVRYYKDDIYQLSDEDLQAVKATDAQIAQAFFAPIDDAETVVLVSTTDTIVEFADTVNQTPITSYTKVNGFYIGKAHQEVSYHEVGTTYNFDGRRPVATVTVIQGVDGEPTTYEKKFSKNASFIDSNQLLLYVRSLDKPSGGFEDSPSKTVFNPYTGETDIVHFGLTSHHAALLSDAALGDTWGYVDLVTVTIGSTPYMQQYNVPNLSKADVDVLHGLSERVDKCKFTTIRFRVGNLAYELVNYDSTIWNAFPDDSAEAQ